MDEQRAWIRSRRRRRLRIVAVILCMCLLATTHSDILAALSALASEWKDGTVYVSGFGELPEAVRAQTVPVGTGIEGLSLPDTLEAFAETPEDEDPSGDADGEGTDKPGEAEDGKENQPEDGTGEPGDGSGDAGNAEDGSGDGTGDAGNAGEGSDDGTGDAGNAGEGSGDGTGDAGNVDEGTDGGTSDTGNVDEGTGGAGEPGGGTDESGNPGEGINDVSGDAGNSENVTDGVSGDAGNADEGNSGEGEPESQSDSAPVDDEGGAEAADEMAKGVSGALTVQRGVFAMPVYLSEPVDAAEPQTMERKAESVMIKGVTWQSEPAYDGNVEGTYVFTAILPDGYALTEGTSLPQITVTVQGTDPVVQELLARIAALPEAEEYLADEPDVEAEDEYEAWMDELSTYTAEALELWEMYETLTEEQRAQIPTEALVKLAAWVELAGQLAESSQVMAAADGWNDFGEGYTTKWKLEGNTLTISGTGEMPDWKAFSTPWDANRGNISTVVIESGVTTIGNYAFNNFSKLTSVTIPDSVTSIGACGMNMCTRLKDVTIPSGVTTIGENAFAGDTAVASVIILGNVTSIGFAAFSGCTALANVTFQGTSIIPTLGSLTFNDCACVADGVKGISIPTCKYLTVQGWLEYKDHVSRSHTLTHTAEKPATCEATGTKEYWTCSACSTKFSDAAGTTVISAPGTIPAKGHALTYTPNDTADTIKQSCSNGCGHSSQAGFTNNGVTVPCTYTGSELKPFIITRWQSWLGDLPSISYENNINVGTATVTLSIDGASVNKTFSIEPKSLEDDSVRVSLSTNAPTYTGSAITPTAIVDDGGRRLTVGTDYTVSYQNNTEVSTNDSKANAVITGKGNYAGTRTVPFTIYPRYLTSAVVTLDTDSLQYTGQALKPTVTGVTANGRTLTPGTDYTVSYNNNINAGSDAQVIITGKGSYTGTCTKTFTITAKSLTDAMVTLNPTSYPYTGSAITPTVTVKDGSMTLTKGTDYTVSCQNNTDVSTTARVTITGTGNYAGTLTKTFTITAKPLTDASITATLPSDSYPYTGNAITPEVTVKDGSRTLAKDTDYTVAYADNTAIGTATITITGKGNYTGTRTEEFTIGKQDLSASRVTVTLGDDSRQYTGQAIELPHAQVIINDIRVAEGTDYTVRYENNINAGSDARIIIIGKGNYAGECAKKFTITPKSLTDATVTAAMLSDSHQYSGTGIEPTVTVSDSAIGSGGSELVKGRDYTVAYQNNTAVSTDASKGQVILTGTGNYTGTLTETFTIVPKSLEDASVTATLDKDSYQYTGKAITPAVTVKDGSRTLAKDTDYTVAYADNTAVGTNTAKVTVTGTGNYTGVRTLAFTIQDKAPEVSGDDLDFSGGTAKLPDDMADKVQKGEVEIYDSDGNQITPNPDGSLPDVEPGTTITIKYPGSDKETEVQIPPRPAAPAPVDQGKVEKTDTTIKAPKPSDGAAYEYVLVEKGEEPDWSRSNTTGEFTGLAPNKEYDLYMRKPATEDSFASEPVKTEIRTSVTVKEPETGGAGAGKPGNDVSGGKPSADGSSVTYTGTCEGGSTPVIIVDGKEIVPEIKWDADGKKGTWSYTVPVKNGDSAVGITVEFKDCVYKGLEIVPGSLRIHADDTENQSADALIDYLRAKCAVKLTYDNGTSEDVANGADYKTDSEFNARGAVYEYTVEASADIGKVTLTVSPVTAAVKAPDALSKSLKPDGYTKAEVDAWLPASVTVTYTGTDGYARRTEGRAVTWDTDALGAGFGAAAGSKTISGTVDLPAWATGENKVGIEVKFVDRQTLADDQMQLSISGWTYGAQNAPEPKGSVAVTDTEQAYTYSYSADGGASWVAAAGLPKSASGHIIPGDYLVEMAYTGRNYTGTKTAAFTVAQKPVTAEKGTLAVEDRNYDGTQNATLKAGGKPALSGVFANDDVSLSGTLKAVFTNKGPKKNIPVTVTGFALAGKDAGYYKLINTTLTLKATINNKDGSSPSSGSGSSDSGNSGGSGSNSNSGSSSGDNGNGSNSSGGSGNSGNTGTGGNNGTGGNTGNGGNSSNNGGNGGNTGGSNKGTGSTGKGSTGSDSTGGTGKSSTIGTGKGSTGTGSISGTGKGTSGTGKGNTGSGITGGIDKGSAGTGSGSTNGTGKSSAGNGNGSTNGTGKDSVGSGSGSNGGTGNGEAGARQADDGQQAKTVTVQTVQAETNDGRIVLPDGTEAPVAIGNLAEDAPGATRLMVGEGTVTVTVVCEDGQYTVGMNDATAVANAVLTPEQVRLVDGGERLEVRVDIKNIAQSISPQDRETVEKGFEAYGKYLPELVRGGYVDISVYTKTGDGGWNAVAETMDPLEVVIGIPEELRGDGREYYIIRAHEGKYALLNDMDAVPETITIVTDQFSSYAIAYREAGAARAGNDETAYGLSHIPPKFLGIVCLICLTAVVAGIIIVVIVLRRKKGYKRENG